MSFTLLLACSALRGQAVKPPSPGVIAGHLAAQVEVFPQEKLHLHVDRSYYMPGEKIWFRAYLTDAIELGRPAASRYVYAEIISPQDSVVARVMIRPQEGMHHGMITLPPELPEGTYTLKAYTQYMEANQQTGTCFRKQIGVGSLLAHTTAIAPEPEEDYHVSFFPEGGNLLSGTLCRVAFKAMNAHGHSEAVNGYLVDDAGVKLLANIRSGHAGMGQIDVLAEVGTRYFFVCTNSAGLEKRFELPQALTGAHGLQAAWRKNHLLVGHKQSADVDHTPPLYLLIHHNGSVCHWGHWGEKEVLTFDKDGLPQGILQLLLFDANLNPLSERLVFNTITERAGIYFETDKPEYGKRQKVSLSLKVHDNEGRPLAGSLSVAVTDNSDVVVDSTMNILSTLLLSSELRGNIENAAYYFRGTPTAELHLDLLMQTQGWRRYNVPQVLKGEYEYPKQPAQTYQEIRGYVKRLLTSKPVVGGDVSLFVNSPIIEGFFSDLTKTAEDGTFAFTGLEFPDSLSMFVQSLNSRGRANARLTMAAPYNPPVLPGDYLAPAADRHTAPTEVMETYIAKAQKRAMYDDDMRTVHLKEVEIVASRKPRDKENSPYQSQYASAFTTAIDQETIERRHATRLIDLFYGIAGVQVVGESNLMIRGPSSINSSTDAMIMVDGVQMDAEMAFQSISPSDVVRIEIFKGADASIFGVRGGTGVVNIILKTGAERRPVSHESFNTRVINPLGYQRPVEFYAPKYETPEQRNAFQPDARATIYWKPNLATDQQGHATLEFYTSDTEDTRYTVVIEGITEDGKLLREEREVVIR